jgi:hypothetical protein
MYICKDCEEDPTSHSFKNIGTDYRGITYFYTCPADASKYNDADGIIKHYDGVLSDHTSFKERTGKCTDWIWIFDGYKFGAKHLLEINVGIKLAKLITQKHSRNLKKIIIINPSLNIKIVLELLYPFLGSLKSLIDIRV